MSEPTSAAVSVRGVTKSFGGGPARVEALGGVDFEAAAGEFTAVMGASGSGKSTLLHLIAGLTPPTAGLVFVGGVNLAALDDDRRTLLRRRRIGLVFQDFNLIDVLTAEENVALPLPIDGRPPAEANRRAYRDLFERVSGPAALEAVGAGQGGFDPACAAGLAGVPGVTAVVPRVQAMAALAGPPAADPVLVVGAAPDPVAGGFRVVEGRAGAGGDEIALER